VKVEIPSKGAASKARNIASRLNPSAPWGEEDRNLLAKGAKSNVLN